MRLALLSDIHGNLHALEACLAHARARQAQRFAFLGDLVGYGADPGAVVERVMLLAEEGALVIKGNHDAMAVNPPLDIKTVGDSTAGWTHQQLTTEHLLWLDSLPMTEHLESTLLVHASADAPKEWHYVYDGRSATASLDAASEWPDVRYVFGGHVHAQTLYYRGMDKRLMKASPEPGVTVPVPKHRQWLCTVGSVGQPRDGRPDSMYAMFDTERTQLTFHRVPYDYASAAKAIRLAGLPEYFAERLEHGR
jgi:diadenosine tetraphosphatase ApaH/serine/threonine PP2A family protein phosphatase